LTQCDAVARGPVHGTIHRWQSRSNGRQSQPATAGHHGVQGHRGAGPSRRSAATCRQPRRSAPQSMPWLRRAARCRPRAAPVVRCVNRTVRKFAYARLGWRLDWPGGGRRRLHIRGRVGLCGFRRGLARREPCQLLGCRVLRLGTDRFGRRAVKGYALVMAKHGLAVDRRHFPATKHTERVRKRRLDGRLLGNTRRRSDAADVLCDIVTHAGIRDKVRQEPTPIYNLRPTIGWWKSAIATISKPF
jgi:hypothetical protein